MRGYILFRVPREDPTEIGKTVQIAEDFRICIRGRSHATFSPAAGRAREIESGRGRVLARNHPVFRIKRFVFLEIENDC